MFKLNQGRSNKGYGKEDSNVERDVFITMQSWDCDLLLTGLLVQHGFYIGAFFFFASLGCCGFRNYRSTWIRRRYMQG